MTEKTKRPAKAEKKPTETTWKEFPKEQRERLAKTYRQFSRAHARTVSTLRRHDEKFYLGKGYDSQTASMFAASNRRDISRQNKSAAKWAALADLIERNLGGAK